MTAQTHPCERELPDGEPEDSLRSAEEVPAPAAAAAGEAPPGDDPDPLATAGPDAALYDADARVWDDGLIARRVQDPSGPRTGSHRRPLVDCTRRRRH